MQYVRIKNWKKHQHYNDRRPPWIKLHNSLFDDYEFQQLSDISRWHLVAIWLLASRSTSFHSDGDPLIPADERYIQRQTGMTGKITLNPLISAGFLMCYQDDSDMIAKCSPETEAYRSKTETETKTPSRKNRARVSVHSASPESQKIYDYYCREIRNHPTSRARALKNIDRLLSNGETPQLLWECINNYADDIQAKKTEEQYRQACGNFFGANDPGYIGYREKAKQDAEVRYAKTV